MLIPCYAMRYVTAVLWFTEKDNRPARSLWRHYPVRLESIFSTRCGNDCGGPGRPACTVLFTAWQNDRSQGSPTKITASAPEPYSVNDWQARIDDSSSPEHVTRIYKYRARSPSAIDGVLRESLCVIFLSFFLSLSVSSASLLPRSCRSVPFVPLPAFRSIARRRFALTARTPFETRRSTLHGVYTLLSRYTSHFDVRRHNGTHRVISHHRIVFWRRNAFFKKSIFLS